VDEIAIAEIELADLPATLREIAALVGIPAAMTLVRELGGTRLYVPATLGEDHLLTRLVGLDAAQRLVAHYQVGMYIDVPLALAATRQARNKVIRARARRGATAPALAREWRTTERHIRRILAGDDSPDEQIGLFDG